MTEPSSTIAVFHLNQVGDLMFSLPALAALREGFPRARLVSVLREELAPLLDGSPLVDDLRVHRGSRDFFATADRLRDDDIDLAVCLSQSPRSRLLSYLSGAPERVGPGGGPLASLLTRRAEKSGLPSTDNNLRVVRELGCPVTRPSYRGLLAASAQERRSARTLVTESAARNGRHLVVLAPGASKGQQHKEWPAERFLEVALDIGARGDTAVFVGTEARPPIEHRPEEGCVDLTGRTDLRLLVGLLAEADLVVGIDSGVLHLAAAVGTPCVALFGPTDPEETGPQGRGHTVVRAVEGRSGAMELIETERVLQAVETLIAASG